MKRRDMLAMSVGASVALGRGTNAWAQTESAEAYPSRLIRAVVPYPPGTFDSIIRVIATKLAAQWGQPIVVENKPGAATMLATAAVAKSPGDGYTLLFGASPVVQNPSLYKAPPYSLNQLIPVAKLFSIPLALVVPSSMGVSTLKDFIAKVKAEPQKHSYANISSGSWAMGEILKQRTGMDMVRVPYAGESPALSDLLGERLSAGFIGPTAADRHAGKLKILAVTSEERIPGVDAPTFAELGFRELTLSGWGGLFVPAMTPEPIVSKLSAAVLRISATPELVERILAAGYSSTPLGHKEFIPAVTEEAATWKRLFAAFEIRAD